MTTVEKEITSRAYTAEEIQDELVENLIGIAHYWVGETKDIRNAFEETDNYYLEGMLHSFYVMFAGGSMGFGSSVDIRPFGTVEQQEKDFTAGRNSFPTAPTNINDGALQYFGYDEELEEVKSIGGPRVWNDDEMRELFHREVAGFIKESTDNNSEEVEAAGALMRSILNLFENGTDTFPKCEIVSTGREENITYHISLDENFYPLETPLTGISRSLVELWDSKWEDSKKVAGY